MALFSIIEWVSTICGLLYVILMMRQNIWCWPFGIISSGLYILSCFHAKIYLEGGLNFYYVIVGFYGWQLWLKKNKLSEEKIMKITEWPWLSHIVNLIICIALTLFLGKIMHTYTDSPRPYFDASITVFSFSATILEARKILSAWIYWFVINGASIVLMIDRGMDKYAFLSAVTTLLCVKGYWDWYKSRQRQSIPTQIPA